MPRSGKNRTGRRVSSRTQANVTTKPILAIVEKESVRNKIGSVLHLKSWMGGVVDLEFLSF
ncbi:MULTISPECIES: hypothetical protein [unclassified Mesorhizobium]|uniref:hypothetical protein n=1 Tax=unclassified Mesorhizobium TaxID=325217 RepID=UPI0013984F66|nr:MULTISPECIES: hypothetical protein [unclassified Mesorhizobium]QIA20320.1 hypothetical protein A9K68_009550 [Mesorhizobium sp. AA22]